MLKLFHSVGLVGALLGAALSAAACSEPESGTGTGSEAGVTVTMNIAAGSTDEGTAVAGEEIHALWVYAFLGERQIGSCRIADTRKEFPDGKIKFLMDLELYSYTEPCDVTFYLIANEDEFHNSDGNNGSLFFRKEMRRAELDEYTFEEIHPGSGDPHAVPLTLRATRRIDPGKVEDNAAPGHDGHHLLTDALEFSLERCVGRLEMYFAKEQSETPYKLEIHSVSVLPRGLCNYSYAFLPDDDGERQALLKTIPHDITSPFYVVGSEAGTPVSVEAETADRDDHTKYADLTAGKDYYCFDNPFGSSDTNAAGDELGYELQVVYSINGGKSVKSVYLPPTARNTRYRIWCYVPYDGLIYVSYKVEEWIETGDVELDFDYPTYEFRAYPLALGNEELNYTTEVHHTQDANSLAGAVRFRMSMTKGISWMPSLLGNAAAYKIDVYPEEMPFDVEDLAGVDKSSLPVGPDEQWYTICITAVHGLEEYWNPATGKTEPPVAFLTVTSQLWSLPNMKLQINRENRFPYDNELGSDYLSYIKITQGENS